MHKGHRERLREKYKRNGLDAFADHEVLELLLFYANKRSDTNETAHRLINRFGSLTGVLEASYEDLKEIPEVGDVAATLITLIPQLFNRYSLDKAKKIRYVKTSEEALEFFAPKFYGLAEERVGVLSVDSQNKINNFSFVTEGGASLAEVDIRQILQIAIRSSAYNVIIAHNHPGGVAAPSKSDIQSTQALIEAFNAVGVRLADHMILTDEEGFSMANHPKFASMFSGKQI